MKYLTDVECRSDSLAVISYRDINQFTYVNLSDACLPEITRLDSVNEAADLIKASMLNLYCYFLLLVLRLIKVV